MSTDSTFRRGSALAALALGALILAGCGSDLGEGSANVSGLAQEARDAGSSENAAALEDGVLDEDELYAAADRYQACVAEAGVQIPEPEISPVDGVTLIWDDGVLATLEGDSAQSANACLFQWTPVQIGYLRSTAPTMDPLLAAEVTGCMDKQGYDIPGDASKFLDFAGDVSASTEQRDAAEACTVDAAERLFPDLANIVIQY